MLPFFCSERNKMELGGFISRILLFLFLSSTWVTWWTIFMVWEIFCFPFSLKLQDTFMSTNKGFSSFCIVYYWIPTLIVRKNRNYEPIYFTVLLYSHYLLCIMKNKSFISSFEWVYVTGANCPFRLQKKKKNFQDNVLSL